MIAALLPALAPILGSVIKSLFPDPAEAAKAEAELNRQLMARAGEIEQAAASIVKTEAASAHWLAANWRPITMLTFVGLIVARWFGFSAPGLSEAEALALWDIVQIGLGGYVVGRTVEKVAPVVMRK